MLTTSRRQLERAYSRRLTDVFGSFEPYPVTSASLAQVHHRPPLKDGGRVALNAVKHGVPTALRVTLFPPTASVITAHLLLQPLRRAPRLPACVAEISRLMGEQLSVTAALANMLTNVQSPASHPVVHVPRVYPGLARERVPVIGFVDGTKGRVFALGGAGSAFLSRGHPVVQEALSQAAARCNINALCHETEVIPRPGARLIAKHEGHFPDFGDQSTVGSGFRTAGPAPAPEPSAGCPGTAEAAVRDSPVLQHGHPHSSALLTRQAANIAASTGAPRLATPDGIDRQYLDALRELCTQHDILPVFEEVFTGFRFAYGDVRTLTGVAPDLTVLDKVIGGGLPGGALIGTVRMTACGLFTGAPFPDTEPRAFLGGTRRGSHLTRSTPACSTGPAVFVHLRYHPPLYSELERRTHALADSTHTLADSCRAPPATACQPFSLLPSGTPSTVSTRGRPRPRPTGCGRTVCICRSFTPSCCRSSTSGFLSSVHSDKDITFVREAFDRSLGEKPTDGPLYQLTHSSCSGDLNDQRPIRAPHRPVVAGHRRALRRAHRDG